MSRGPSAANRRKRRFFGRDDNGEVAPLRRGEGDRGFGRDDKFEEWEMRYLWCWRCRAEVPMLNEEEFAMVMSKFERSLPGRGPVLPMLAEYNRITGIVETNPNVIWDHRLSRYGAPCKACGKPLRTPRAKLCGSCMAPVEGG